MLKKPHLVADEKKFLFIETIDLSGFSIRYKMKGKAEFNLQILGYFLDSDPYSSKFVDPITINPDPH